jgi:hypothetical protein
MQLGWVTTRMRRGGVVLFAVWLGPAPAVLGSCGPEDSAQPLLTGTFVLNKTKLRGECLNIVIIPDGPDPTGRSAESCLSGKRLVDEWLPSIDDRITFGDGVFTRELTEAGKSVVMLGKWTRSVNELRLVYQVSSGVVQEQVWTYCGSFVSRRGSPSWAMDALVEWRLDRVERDE